MSIRYLSDHSGKTTDIVISIEDWENITQIFPEVESHMSEIPGWQKKLLDERLKLIEEHPELLMPIEELFEELDK